jgi:hypothetical protein
VLPKLMAKPSIKQVEARIDLCLCFWKGLRQLSSYISQENWRRTFKNILTEGVDELD